MILIENVLTVNCQIVNIGDICLRLSIEER